MAAEYGAVESKDGLDEKSYEMKSMGPAAVISNVFLGDEQGISHKLVTRPSFRDRELNKWERIIEGASNKAPPSIVPCLKVSQNRSERCMQCCLLPF